MKYKSIDTKKEPTNGSLFFRAIVCLGQQIVQLLLIESDDFFVAYEDDRHTEVSHFHQFVAGGFIGLNIFFFKIHIFIVQILFCHIAVRAGIARKYYDFFVHRVTFFLRGFIPDRTRFNHEGL